jgi:hypothetical protein
LSPIHEGIFVLLSEYHDVMRGPLKARRAKRGLPKSRRKKCGLNSDSVPAKTRAAHRVYFDL